MTCEITNLFLLIAAPIALTFLAWCLYNIVIVCDDDD